MFSLLFFLQISLIQGFSVTESGSWTHAQLTVAGFHYALSQINETAGEFGKNIESYFDSITGGNGEYNEEMLMEIMGPETNAVLRIVIASNEKIDSTLSDRAVWHVNADQIEEASNIVSNHRYFAALFLKEGLHRAAFETIGEILHVIQDLYSSSSFVDLVKDLQIFYENFGTRNKTGKYKVVDGFACTRCNCRNDDTQCECAENIILEDADGAVQLTSGYRNDQDIKMPESGQKCSDSAPGGISKSSRLSPRGLHHAAAAQRAVLHTAAYFTHPRVGLRTAVGAELFDSAFQLDAPATLVFVLAVAPGGAASQVMEELSRDWLSQRSRGHVMFLWNSGKEILKETTDSIDGVVSWLSSGREISSAKWSNTVISVLDMISPSSTVVVLKTTEIEEPKSDHAVLIQNSAAANNIRLISLNLDAALTNDAYFVASSIFMITAVCLMAAALLSQNWFY